MYVLLDCMSTEEQNSRYKTEKRGGCSILLVRRESAVSEWEGEREAQEEEHTAQTETTEEAAECWVLRVCREWLSVCVVFVKKHMHSPSLFIKSHTHTNWVSNFLLLLLLWIIFLRLIIIIIFIIISILTYYSFPKFLFILMVINILNNIMNNRIELCNSDLLYEYSVIEESWVNMLRE